MTTALVPAPMPTMTEQEIASIAWEMARGLRSPDDIIKKHGLTKEQFAQHIDTNSYYKRVLEAAVIEWASTGNTKSRIVHKAGLALEENIVQLAKRMSDDEEDLGKAMEVAKLFAKIAGVDASDKVSGVGEKFTITINLGADEKFTKTIEAQDSPTEVRAVAEGESDTPQI